MRKKKEKEKMGEMSVEWRLGKGRRSSAVGDRASGAPMTMTRGNVGRKEKKKKWKDGETRSVSLFLGVFVLITLCY